MLLTQCCREYEEGEQGPRRLIILPGAARQSDELPSPSTPEDDITSSITPYGVESMLSSSDKPVQLAYFTGD